MNSRPANRAGRSSGVALRKSQMPCRSGWPSAVRGSAVLLASARREQRRRRQRDGESAGDDELPVRHVILLALGFRSRRLWRNHRMPLCVFVAVLASARPAARAGRSGGSAGAGARQCRPDGSDGEAGLRRAAAGRWRSRRPIGKPGRRCTRRPRGWRKSRTCSSCGRAPARTRESRSGRRRRRGHARRRPSVAARGAARRCAAPSRRTSTTCARRFPAVADGCTACHRAFAREAPVIKRS